MTETQRKATNLETAYGYKFEALSTLKASGLRISPCCRKGKVPGYNELVRLAVEERHLSLKFCPKLRG